MELAKGTLLQDGKYRIEKVLGQGGFGITYLAEQVRLGRKVAIKEFFIKQRCIRDAETNQMKVSTPACQGEVQLLKIKFQKEALIISQLRHPNIVEIHDIFEENDTSYYVMEHIEGDSLFDIINKEGFLSEEESLKYIRNIGEAIKYMHSQNTNHLDIKPSNIMVRKSDHKIILIDFGLSKRFNTAGEQTTDTPLGISPGYAPVEQYVVGGVSTFSPQSDIYSLGATLYALLVGKTPPDSHSVLNNGLPDLPSHISEKTCNAIRCAMQVKKENRPATLDEFLALLPIVSPTIDGEDTIIPGGVMGDGSGDSGPEPKSRIHIYIIIAILSFLCLFAISYWGMNHWPPSSKEGSGNPVDTISMEKEPFDDKDVINGQDGKEGNAVGGSPVTSVPIETKEESQETGETSTKTQNTGVNKPEISKPNDPPARNSSISFEFGSYSGPDDGNGNGNRGEISVTSSYSLSTNGGTMSLEPGDKIVNTQIRDGKLRSGVLVHNGERTTFNR